ncbi:hypothetical protein EVAR_6135_1 [Eumeta japonica]|uniref:Mos1 transposase HTH domain-containing protein n=1 Tax=Eumeta variegata TaxID=151549 RepID=A0A4C1TFD7_EUMVA|nr:hypothetical protein EVAR_6135_1 [Eumeta japonica]
MSAESSNLSIEHRAVIKYFKERKTPKEIFEDMVSVLQESAPSYTMVKNGLAYFNKDERAVKMILAQGIAEELQISKERVGEIIHEHMNMRKISARWVPKMLTTFDKQRRLQTSTRQSYTEATWEVIARSAVLQDNASVHTARVSRQALKDTGFSEIDHPPYSLQI